MNPGTFLKNIGRLITGDGFVREKHIPLASLINTSGTALALASNVAVIYLQDDDDSVTVQFQVPLDYDESMDELAVVLTALLTTGDLSVGTDYITLDFDQVKYMRAGETAAVDETANVTSDAQDVDDDAIAQYVFNLSGLGLLAGDCLSIEIDATETGAGEAGIYGCLLYTSPSPRDATLSRMPSSA